MPTPNSSLKQKPIQTQTNEFVPVDLKLTVLTRIVAPKLSDFRKSDEIAKLLECYKSVYQDLSDDEIELIKHIDRAFKRDALCRPWISTNVLSAAFREILNDQSITFRGVIFIDPKSIGIYAEKRPSGLEVYEYIKEGTTIDARVLVNSKELSGPYIIMIGAKRTKGYGQVKIELSYPKK